MLRILTRIGLAIVLVMAFMPSTAVDASAGKRYKRHHGKSYSHSRSYHRSKRARRYRSHKGHHRFKRRNRYRRIVLNIPFTRLGSQNNYSISRYKSSSGPKIINVPEELRRRRLQELRR